MVPTARSIAATVLVRVEKDGAFASAALEAELSRAAQLDPRDRGLATELVYGSLRVLPWLVAQLDRHAKKGTRSLEARTRAELCIAVYQLFFLARVPAFAAVSEAVDAVRATKGPKVAAFANAVLRKLATEAKGASPEAARARSEEALWTSAAPWVRQALARALDGTAGEGAALGARAFLSSGLEPPPLGLRVEEVGQRDAWLARFREAMPSATFELGRVSELAILARGAGRPQGLPGWEDGAWSVQEEGSQLVALAVGARPGEVVLDACAGRGNKTAVLARAVGAGGAADAADMHPAKLDRLRAEMSRLRLAPRTTFAVDWTVGSGDCVALYDRVLVDAPCSGLGTLRRRPEIQTRRTGDDLEELAALQLAIARRASERVRAGGHLLYAVCSVLREEAEDVVSALLREVPALEPAPFASTAAGALASGQTTLRLLPHVHGTDGYFLASLRKKE